MFKKGIFITFEGPDGSGKSTIINLVQNELVRLYGRNKIVLTREPGGKNNLVAEDIRNILLNKLTYKISDRTEALLFAASRAQHVKDFIIPNLKSKKIVLCDRYIHSSLVYQGYARKLGMKNILKINEFAIDKTMPDFTILLMISPEKGLARINQNEKRDKNRLDLERLEIHKRVYQGYLKISKINKNKIITINANQSVEKVFLQTMDAINKKIKKYVN